MKSLTNAIPAAFLTAILWYFINQFATQNGVGFLERQPWPINDMYVCIVIGAVFGIVSSLIALWFVDRRRQAMEAAAGMLGLTWRDAVDQNSLRIEGRLYIFRDWEAGTNLICGEFDGVDLKIFDLEKEWTSRSQSSSGGSSNDTHNEHQTIFLFALPEGVGVPIQMLRKNALGWLLDAIGFEGIEFHTNDSFASEEVKQTLQKFNDEYRVVQGHMTEQSARMSSSSPGILKESLAQLERRISFPLLMTLANGQRWSVEVCESHLAVWEHKTRQKPNSLANCLNEVTEIYQLFVDGSSSGPQMRLEVTGAAPIKMDAGISLFAPILAFGCLGMFLAFALFVPIFFLFVEDHPWLVFIWPFFGMAIMGGCIYFGTRFMKKRRKASGGSS
ncbi:MAG: hypothetical protein GY758_09270 [Fuerstiella sp.]|nr:hypothetical protein [Fuerstiella sp.]